jgi:outer membrane protein OmpA-like peptidoglycan-associated protein
MFKGITAALAVLSLSGMLATTGYSQSSQANPTQQRRTRDADRTEQQVPVFRVTVVGRTTPAVNYRHRSGATMIDFRGTPLLPEAHGEAKVESKQGYMEIEVEFDELVPATKFGPEYLTYVMWAITPEGRATNLGEVILNGSESKLNVTTELQAFGLIVTAEPYFAVSQPSDVVVMENVIRRNTRGDVETIDAKYELLQRGTYLMASNPRDLPVRRLDSDVPLDLHEARNALHFARVAGADEYAVDTYQKARGLLSRAEEMHEKDRNRRQMISVAREATQAAEDARLIALQRREAELVARDRQRTLEREATARANEAAAVQRARDEERQRQLAETERARAEADRQTAQRRLNEAEDAAARSARERSQLEAQRAAAERERAEAESARRAAEQARAEAERAAEQLARERASAEARAQQLAAERASAEARAQQASEAAAQAERERTELREKLQQQLNLILETRESARGLIVNMSDVLFDTGSATLKPGAREKLARVAGVLLAYPGLEIEIEGHTDSVGGDDYNQHLSERRAASVRAYLIQQGIPQHTVDAMGFGESRPVVDNRTAAGRQQNRRVELVISGEPIATTTTERRERQ